MIIFLFWFPEHKATNTTSNPTVISSDPVFCLFDCLDPITTVGGGDLTEGEEVGNRGGGWHGEDKFREDKGTL